MTDPISPRACALAHQSAASDSPEARTAGLGRIPVLLLLSAPSGAGKTTLCQELLQRRPGLTRAITCTTRPPRPGERDGVDYHFLDPETYARRVAAGEFLEHATVYGHGYGTLRQEVLDRLRAGQDVLLNVDVQGAAAIRARAREEPLLQQALVTVFLTPPSRAVLEARLRRRGTDPEPVIQRRLAMAQTEIAHWKDFDYLILSGSIAEDVQRLEAILEAEKLRSHRQPAPAF
jgi:guanylate kinase